MKTKTVLLLILSFSFFSKNYGFDQQAYEKAISGEDGIYLGEQDLSDANTEEYNLIGINLQNAILSKAKLQYSLINNANLREIKGYKSNFFKANLTDANLEEADLKKAIFNQAILIHTNFCKADLTDASFSISDIENPWYKFKRSIQKLKYEFGIVSKPKYYSEYPNCIGANFQEAIANNTKFQNLLLINANFKGADLTNAKFNNSILVNADFSDVKSFRGTDLRGTNLYKAKFHNANLEGIIVDNVVFYQVEGLTESQKEYLIKNGAIFYLSLIHI